jgi:23S rRNA pseudouridine1911/1915/1917 synthase
LRPPPPSPFVLGRDLKVAKTKPESGEKLFRVLPRQVDQTIAAVLREWLPGQSWSEVRRLLKSRRVAINGNLCVDAGRRLRLTDVVKILAQSLPAPPDELDIRIVHLDKHVVVVEKPSGMTTTRHSEEQEMSPRRRQIQPTLDELLPRVIAKIEARGTKDIKGKKPAKKGIRQVRAVHRLDRDTSGLLVFARTAESQQHLEQQFRKHTTHRRYLAVVRGAVESQTIESSLVRDRGDGRRGSTTLPNVGRRAVTHVRAVERLGDYTLIECRLETGRTHQIRIHLSEKGHPLCGDKVYGQPLFRAGEPDTSGAPRLALCAVELGFVHPVTGESMRFESPPPGDFAGFVRQLRIGARQAKPTP